MRSVWTVGTTNLERKPLPLDPLYLARIVWKGEQVAELKGIDADDLRSRAHRFASAQGWHRAVVEVSHA